MAVPAAERHELWRERRLLQDILALVRRCDGCPPATLLDAVLGGSSPVRPVLPVDGGQLPRGGLPPGPLTPTGRPLYVARPPSERSPGADL